MELQSHRLPETLVELQEEHRKADLRAAELDSHLWLSPEEQQELARLKKQKLQMKDRMRKMTGHY